ncbi:MULTISPECIES: hypothetical protein [unclassified Chelatococcus]|nr:MULTISPECIES: hypothetical protein [unclassified Chelatococcus]MBS7738152.1 hypothetical protein [Chelatococcus sp. HY11]MBX3545680.1 hypothetical protein [Chelatococcus sp.]MCO5077502.1 hypothetical protein [Chelatococcus sp.]
MTDRGTALLFRLATGGPSADEPAMGFAGFLELGAPTTKGGQHAGHPL